MYIDPGFGSLFFQSCIAVAVSFGVFWMKPIKIIRNIFHQNKCLENDPADNMNDSDTVDENGFLK